jgi:hypothetical protein
LVQEYETTFGDEPTQRDLNYWFYDAEADRFRIIFFSNNGPFSEDGNRHEGRVADGGLTFVGPARFQHELDADGDIKVAPDGTITVSWSLRDKAGEWQPWMTNTFRAGDDAVRCLFVKQATECGTQAITYSVTGGRARYALDVGSSMARGGAR